LSKKLNDILLFVFILSLATGSTLFLVELKAFSLFAFRIAVFLVPVLLFINKSFYKFDKREVNLLLVLFLCFFIYAAVSVFWVPNQLYAVKAVLYITTVLLMAITLISLAQHTNNFLKKFLYAWIGGFIINVIIAFWEISTGGHFESEYTDILYTLHPGHFVHFSPSSVFGNPNHFAIYLVHSLIIFILLRKYLPSVLFGILITLTVLLIYFTYSKLALISVIFPLAYWIYRERQILLSRLYIRQLFIYGLTFLIIISGIFLFNKLENPRQEILLANSDKVKKTVQSSVTRKNLVKEGIGFVKSSNGLGIGAGQFQHYLEKEKGHFVTTGITSPHSGTIEIVAEYGVPVILLAIIYWLWLGVSLARSRRFVIFHIYLVYTGSLILLSNANSGFVSSPVSWLLIILPVVFTLQEEESFC
jgi:teichuronic acid biosynthesis protein TuaE